MKSVLLVLSIFIAQVGSAQQVVDSASAPAPAPTPPPSLKSSCPTVTGNDTIYDMQCVDKVTEYDGGTTAMYQYLGKQLKYPNQARLLGIEGKVYMKFIVQQDGTVSDVSILKGIMAIAPDTAEQADYDAAVKELHNNTIEIIKEMPKWIPGTYQGKAVKMRFIIPIIFKLQS